MDKVQIDVTVIGGGIIGLTAALEIKRANLNLEVAVLEKMPFLADHASGRNSGVLHSGLYYDTHSLKHQLCIEGLELWNRRLTRGDIPHRFCQKTIFAHTQDEAPRLEELALKSKQNGVPFHFASHSELSELQKNVNAVQAIIVESTGIIDTAAAMLQLRREFEELGGIVQVNTNVQHIERQSNNFFIKTQNFNIESTQLINAAGLWAPEMRKFLDLTDLNSKWVKGHYLKTSQKLNYQTLYYPVPPADLKGLGVHSTIDCQGDVKFGPDTLDVDEINYELSDKHLSDMRKSVLERFVSVDVSRLQPDYAGIRSKILHNGVLHKDFWIKGPNDLAIPGYVEACGIESPGVTASLAIAKRCQLLLGF